MRVEGGGALGETDELEELRHAAPARGRVEIRVDDERLRHDRRHPHARIQRRVGILKDRLDRAPITAPSLGIQPVHVLPVEANRACRRTLEPEDQLGGRRLAAAGFADEAERGASFQRERDRIHRAHERRGPSERAAAYREVLGEIRGLEQRARGVQALACSQHRVLWPSATRISIGDSVRQRSITCAHRGANAQPGGSVARSGGCPSIVLRRAALAPRRHRSEQRARVGMLGRGEDLAHGADLHDPAGVHHRDAIAHARDDAEVVRGRRSCRTGAAPVAPSGDSGTAPGS